MPRVSVVMSVYKEPVEWLRQSIDSILAQTFTDFELIIINDCPARAENGEVLNEYRERDHRIVVITNDDNIGLTKSLNKGLSIAKGEYIARMDADDISLPKRFERQVAFLDSHPEICGIGTWTGSVDAEGNVNTAAGGMNETYPRWVRAQFLQNSQVAHPAAMFRKRVKDYTVRYDESVRYAQDYSLWVSMLRYGEIANIPEVLFCYRTSEQQITSSKKAEQQQCAGVAQRKAFELFGFPTTEAFLNQFFKITIEHSMEMPLSEVSHEFRQFLTKAKLTKENALALEVIYSSYLTYLQNQSGSSRSMLLLMVWKNSTAKMLWLGCKLVVDLLQRKRRRKAIVNHGEA